MMALRTMLQALHRYRGWGAEPDVFIIGSMAAKRLDVETDASAQMFTVETGARRHRELAGVPVVVSRHAHPDSIELVTRVRGAPPQVAKLA